MKFPRFRAMVIRALPHRRLATAGLFITCFGGTVPVAAMPSQEELAELFQPPVCSDLKVSPTGEYIGFIARRGDEFGVGIYTVATGKLILGRRSGVRPLDYFWKGPRRLLIESTSAEFNALGFTAVDVDGTNVENVWQLTQTSGRLVDALVNDPTHVLVANRDGVHRFDLQRGKGERIAGGELGGVGKWILDDQARPRAAMTLTHDRSRIFEWNSGAGGKWHRKIIKPDEKTFLPFCVGDDPRFLLGWDEGQGGELVVSRFDTVTEQREVLVRKPGLDPTFVVLQGTTGRPLTVNYGQKTELLIEPLEESERPAVTALRERFAGFNPIVLDKLPDHRTWLVKTSNSRLPGAYVLFNTQSGEVTPVAFAHDEALREDRLAPAEFFSLAVPGGRGLTGRLWRPAGVDRPPLVMICPRSLPTMPALDDYKADVQALVACGFAVARVNVRGTHGFGDEWRAAATGDIAPTLTADLEAAARELIRQQVVDATRVHLLGWNRGGALALQVAARSDVFVSAVAINPPAKISRSDLLKFSEGHELNQLSDRLGGWWETGRIADALSPVEAVTKLRAPALVLADADSLGGTDEDGARIRRAAKSAGKSVKVEEAYSWSKYPKPPTVLARENAALMLKAAKFLTETQRPAEKTLAVSGN